MDPWTTRSLRCARAWLLAVLALLSFAVHAQDTSAPATTFKPEELEALVAPIALYPDSVLAQVLMASTYPLEIVQAARWVKANPKVKARFDAYGLAAVYGPRHISSGPGFVTKDNIGKVEKFAGQYR